MHVAFVVAVSCFAGARCGQLHGVRWALARSPSFAFPTSLVTLALLKFEVTAVIHGVSALNTSEWALFIVVAICFPVGGASILREEA